MPLSSKFLKLSKEAAEGLNSITLFFFLSLVLISNKIFFIKNFRFKKDSYFILFLNLFIKKLLFLPNIYAFEFLQSFLDNRNLSPFFARPPTIQKTLEKDFKILDDEEKLVALESLIIVKCLDLKIICCLYCRPLNFFNTLNKNFFFIFSSFAISKIKDKFSLFPSVIK